MLLVKKPKQKSLTMYINHVLKYNSPLSLNKYKNLFFFFAVTFLGANPWK